MKKYDVLESLATNPYFLLSPNEHSSAYIRVDVAKERCIWGR